MTEKQHTGASPSCPPCGDVDLNVSVKRLVRLAARLISCSPSSVKQMKMVTQNWGVRRQDAPQGRRGKSAFPAASSHPQISRRHMFLLCVDGLRKKGCLQSIKR